MPRWVIPSGLLAVAVVFRLFGGAERFGTDILALSQLISASAAALSIQIAYQERR